MFTRNTGYWNNDNDELETSFFNKLTDPKSQREDWYAVCSFIAEFWCAISNIGFLYVGITQSSPELLFAGCASIVSHTIPKQWLLTVDKIGILVVLSKVIREYAFFFNNQTLLLYLPVLAIINVADAFLARNYHVTSPHVFWHLSAAYIGYCLLSAFNR